MKWWRWRDRFKSQFTFDTKIFLLFAERAPLVSMIADITKMKKADWYFDFISPFAYIGFTRLDRLSHKLEIRYRPVLFAGLLNHWEQKGPAEIPPKAHLDLSLMHLVGRPTGHRVSLPGCSPLQPSTLSPACHSRRQQAAGHSPDLRSVVDDESFWGADAMDFVEAYLADPGIVATDEMRRATNLPVAASRRRD